MTFSINSNNSFPSGPLSATQKKQQEAIQRLSTLLRINSAKDDAAGSAIFQRQTASILGANQAARNANDGISLAQTAEGSLTNITSNLHRMRELAVQAANAPTTNRSALQAEANQLVQENTRVSESTSFAGQALFPTNSQTVSFQVGGEGESQVSANLNSLDALNSVNSSQSGSTIDLSSAESAQLAIEKIDADLEEVSLQAAEFGALQNRFSAAIEGQQTLSINTQAARSRNGDADFAKELSKLIQSQIQDKANVAVRSQANQSKELVLSLLGGK